MSQRSKSRRPSQVSGRLKAATPIAGALRRLPVGRPPIKPSVDDTAAVERMCERLVGGMSMVVACSRPDCPSATAVYQRMARDAEFAAIIGRAREAQQHAIIDQTVDMADKATPENWQVVRLRIWARQWRAC